MAGETISIKIRLQDGAKFAGETRAAKVEIKGLGDAAARANRKSREAGGGLDVMRRSLNLLKPALIAAGIGIFVQAMSAGSAGVVGFVAALAPALGLLGAFPAALLGAAQGAGVLKLAFSGIGGALGGLHGEINPKKFEALTGPAQSFVLILNRLKAPVIAIQRAVQGKLFSGLTEGLKDAAPAVSALAGPLARTGGVFGQFGAHLGKLVGSHGFLTDLKAQANFNNRELVGLSGAGIHVVDTLRQIVVTSRPLVAWLVRLAGGWAATADKTATADRANGKLARGFGIVRHVVGDVFKIVGNLGVAVFNVANIGRKHLGESLLTSLVKGSESLKHWTESGKGVQNVTRFFEQAKPVVYAFAKLLGAVAVDFLKFGGGGSGLATFIERVRTEVLPQLLKVSEVATRLFEFIASKIPGGGWLLTLGFTLSRLGGGGGGGGLFSGVGRGIGTTFGESIAKAAKQKLAAAFASTAIATGPLGGAFATAGATLGGVFEVALAAAVVAGVVILAKKVGEKLAAALHPQQYITPSGQLLSSKQRKQKENTAEQVIREAANEERRAQAIRAHRPFTIPTQSERQQERQMYRGHVEPYTGPAKPSLFLRHSTTPILQGPTLRAPTTAEVHATGGGHGGSAAPIHIHTHTTLKLDSKPVAEGTSEVVARHNALK